MNGVGIKVQNKEELIRLVRMHYLQLRRVLKGHENI